MTANGKRTRCLTGWFGLVLLLGLSIGNGQAGLRFDPPSLAPGESDIDGGLRVRAFGPFYESSVKPDGSALRAVRPLYARLAEPARETIQREVLWPVATMRTTVRENDWRILTAFGHDFDTTDPESRCRVWVLPLLFWGTDAETNDYLAVFPLGGSIHEFMGLDSADFVMFPLYVHAADNDLASHTFLWPILSWTTGDDVAKFRVFPFYGWSRRGTQSEKRFILWPLWTSSRYSHPGASGSGFMFFPFVGHVEMENQETWMVLPPFFRWTRAATLREGHWPWPFVQASSGDVDKLYLWPLWGYKETQGQKSSFYLWPIGRYNEREVTNGVTYARTLVLPVLYNESLTAHVSSNTPPQVLMRRLSLWPVAKYERGKARSHFKMLNLWPMHTAAVERNLAPFWTLYTHQCAQDAAEDELLWGLFRYTRKPSTYRHVAIFPLVSWDASAENSGRLEWSVLKGILGRRREGDVVTYRILYLFRTGPEGVKP